MPQTIRLSRAFNALIIERDNGAIYNFALEPGGRRLSVTAEVRLIQVLQYLYDLDKPEAHAEADSRLDPKVAEFLLAQVTAPAPKTPAGKLDLGKLNLEDL